METPHLASLGARPVPRKDFVALLDQLTASEHAPARWPAAGVRDAFRKP